MGYLNGGIKAYVQSQTLERVDDINSFNDTESENRTLLRLKLKSKQAMVIYYYVLIYSNGSAV
jgi:hypothetical protein